MALAHVPDPDLVIRTGGEQRLSNFLLWQAAYAELYFSDKLWPEFDEAALTKPSPTYAARERRFGQTSGAGRAAGRCGRSPHDRLPHAQATHHHRHRPAGDPAAGAVLALAGAVRCGRRSC